MPTRSPQRTKGPVRPAVLVTGAARRIGRAVALDLAAAGYAVAVHYNGSAREAAAVAREIGPGRGAIVQADLADEAQTETLIARAAAALGGPLTALINNASAFGDDSIATMTRASWDAHLEPNLRAPLVLIQAFARQLPKGAEGVVVNVIDQRVWRLTPRRLSYTLSKAALWTATQTLAQALAPRIRVNAVGPGPTLQSPTQSAAYFRRQAQATILKRGASPQDICDAVRYLIGARAVTGQMIAVDGGQHLAWQTPDVASVQE